MFLSEGSRPFLTSSLAGFIFVWLSVELYHCTIESECSWNSSGVTNKDVFEYPETVDIRIVVLTYNRPKSLIKCLDHVNNIITDGDTMRVEVWVDRYINGTVDERTVSSLEQYVWKSHVMHRVHVHRDHAGLYGQWIRTWRPNQDTSEIALYLEDDVDVSPYAYRWLKSAYGRYRGDPDLAGISLQEDYVITAAGRRKGVTLKTPDYDPIYKYRIVGPWAFSPHPQHWRRFQDWFLSLDPQYSPHVPEAGLYDTWYSDMEEQNKTHSMWIMWFIHFCHRQDIYTGYANLRVFTKNPNVSLAMNRREDGLHFKGRSVKNTEQFLLHKWNNTLVQFPEDITKLDYDGTFS